MYKVKQEDLKGDIEGFPIEVVQKMLDTQVWQGNKADVGVFQRYRCSNKNMGGFDWNVSECDFSEGYSLESLEYDFWVRVIAKRDFDLFFKHSPKASRDTKKEQNSKPLQYREGIDTFERMKANATKEEIIGACKLNIDKYVWRKKETDAEDLKKAKDYIDLWLDVINEEEDSCEEIYRSGAT